MNRRRFLRITAAAALVPGAATAETRWRGVALGAEAEVVLTGPGADRALAALPALLNRVEADFSLHRPGSALAQLNATGHLADPSADFRALCALTDRIHALTQGAFDPTIQPLWRALADGGDAAAAQAAVGWHRVRHGADIRLGPGQALTFNGIAQGHATDRVREELAARGFTRALIDIGEVAALGGPFTLGVEDPAFGRLGRRRITGTALATSSPGALAIGARAHILHPRGLPPLWSSVTVEADSAAVADALATALVFATAPEIARLRRALPEIRSVTLIDPAGDLTTL